MGNSAEWLGWWTAALGVVWALALLSLVSYVSADLNAVKGILQRADQVVLGVWLALLGFAAAREGGLGAG